MRSFLLFFCMRATTKEQDTSPFSMSSSSSSRRRRYCGFVQKVSTPRKKRYLLYLSCKHLVNIHVNISCSKYLVNFCYPTSFCILLFVNIHLSFFLKCLKSNSNWPIFYHPLENSNTSRRSWQTYLSVNFAIYHSMLFQAISVFHLTFLEFFHSYINYHREHILDSTVHMYIIT